MISVQQAISYLQAHCNPIGPCDIDVTKSLHYAIYEPVVATQNLPRFRQSAMDGYAVSHHSNKYVVKTISKAGDTAVVHLDRGEACRIFTGALVPDNADTVVIQEDTSLIDDELTVHRSVKRGSNIREIGEHVKAGETILPQYHRITPAGIGMLVECGITKVRVFQKPSIAVLVTGNEFLDPSDPIQPGKIYDSNSIMLHSALISQGFEDVNIYKVKDDLRATRLLIEKALDSYDVILITGGISVGDYDFVRAAMKANQVDEIFYGIKQKPGKPMWFGKKKDKTVFGLPGNPASALTCFYIYVLPAIEQMMGIHSFDTRWKSAKVNSTIYSPQERALFLKAFVHDETIDILGKQNSSMLHSFASANAIVHIPEHVSVV